jgi:hypothetical protein
LAGPGKHVEVDETLIGGKSQARGFGSRLYKKTMVMGMVERGRKMRAGPVPDDRIDTLEPLAVAHVHKGTIVSTDGLPSYNALGDTFDLAWFAMPRANGGTLVAASRARYSRPHFTEARLEIHQRV